MEGNETVLAALYFLLDPDVACRSFLNASSSIYWCCLNTLNCVDMSIYSELCEDVDYFTRDDDICWYVKSFPDCIIDQSFHVNAFCNKYIDVMETNFGGYVQVLVDKYTYNGTCYDDYDYVTDIPPWSTWSTTDVSGQQNIDNYIMTMIGVISGGIVCLIVVLFLLFVCWFHHKKLKTRPSQEENTAYNLEIHRGSVDYDVINDESVEQIRYVSMNLGNVDERHVEEEKGNVDGKHVEEENDSCVFTVTTESPTPGYDGLSNFRRLRMERQYTTLSIEEECEYILQPESIPNFKVLKDKYTNMSQDTEPVYFEPKSDHPTDKPSLPAKSKKDTDDADDLDKDNCSDNDSKSVLQVDAHSVQSHLYQEENSSTNENIHNE